MKLDSQIEIIDNRWDHRNLIVFTGGFSGGNNVNRRHLMDSATPYNRRKRRLLIALEPDYVQSQKLLSERLWIKLYKKSADDEAHTVKM